MVIYTVVIAKRVHQIQIRTVNNRTRTFFQRRTLADIYRIVIYRRRAGHRTNINTRSFKRTLLSAESVIQLSVKFKYVTINRIIAVKIARSYANGIFPRSSRILRLAFQHEHSHIRRIMVAPIRNAANVDIPLTLNILKFGSPNVCA